ncbi:MAG: hypothetical protein E3J72_09755 [Planctomycetota bacterium]|nr:MAG: hypothetical protein E3J72_09755 [Planctomycetota bacterium]
MKGKTWFWLTALFVLVALATGGQILAEDEKNGKKSTALDIPPFDGHEGDALTEAVADYTGGKIASAVEKAGVVRDDSDSSKDEVSGAKKLLALVEKLGGKRLKAAEAAYKRKAYFEAQEIWSLTLEQFGASLSAGAEAKKCLKSKFKDSDIKKSLKAQRMLSRAKELESAGKKASAKLMLKNIIRSCAGTDEAGEAGEMLKRLGGSASKSGVKTSSKSKSNKSCPFGTVTKEERIPGDMDCKGSAKRLVQGGYMKFDLSSYPKGKVIRGATLKVYVETVSKNPWLWVCNISMDPTTAPVEDIFKAIQAHRVIISGPLKIRAGQWKSTNLNRKAVNEIQAALKSTKTSERWYALSLTFE